MKILNYINDKWTALTASLLLSVLLVTPAYAVDWIAGVDDWTTGANWSPAVVPNPAVSVFINNGGTAQLNADTGSAASLAIGVTATGSLDISNGGELISSGSGFLGYFPGSSGSMTVADPASILTILGEFDVGFEGTGSLDISNGGKVNSLISYVGRHGGSNGSAVTVDGAGSHWSNSSDLYVGVNGNSTLNISNGGKVSNVIGYLGYGTNGYSGSVTVTDAGSLWVNSSDLYIGLYSHGTLNISNGGIVTVGGTTTLGSYDTPIISTGTLNIGTGGAAGILNTASVEGGLGTATLNFNHTDTGYYFTNDGTATGTPVLITGTTAVNHIGSGTTFLNGTNTYTGATTINAGTLWVNGSIANSTTTVNTDGVLSGSGTVGSVTVSGGTLSVAAGDTLTVDGDYTQTGNGVFEVGATSVSNYGKLIVTGIADLNANNQLAVNVTANETLADGNVLNDVLTAGTLTAGALTVADSSVLWDFTAVVDGNTIDITTQQATTPDDPATPITVSSIITDAGLNEPLGGAAAVLDTLLASGATNADMTAILNELGALSSSEEIVQAVEQMVPALTGGVSNITNATLAGIVNAINFRLGGTSGASSGDAMFADRYFWVKPYATDTDQDTRRGIAGYDGNTTGIIFGADAEVNDNWRVGAAIGYSQSDSDSKSAVAYQKIDADTWSAALYAERTFDQRTHLTLQASAGRSDYDSKRGIAFGGVNRMASADYDSTQYAFNAILEREYQISTKMTLTPNVYVDYRYADVDSYTEKGAGALNLRVASDTADTLIVGVGARADYKLSLNSTLSADLGVGHDSQADNSSLSSSFAGGGAAFITRGNKPDSTVWQAGLGYEHVTQSGLEVNVRYDLEARSDYDDQAISANLRWQF